MSEETPPDAAGVPPPQKKVSGLLMVSIMLTMMGVFVIPVLPTVAGLITAVKGRRRALTDPFVIGPRFGMFCLIAALLALPFNGWQMYGFYDEIQFRVASSEAVDGVFSGLRERNYEKAYEHLDESCRERLSLEEFSQEMMTAFPGGEPLVLGEGTIEARSKTMSEADQKLWKTFLTKKSDTLDFTSEIIVMEGDARTNLDIRILARRRGWADYTVQIMEFRAWPSEDPDETAPGTTEPEKTPDGIDPGDAPEDEPK